MEAHYRRKRDVAGVGYNGPLTETCDPDQPQLLTQVETRPATQPDAVALPTLQAALAAKQRLPREHWVDAGDTPATG